MLKHLIPIAIFGFMQIIPAITINDITFTLTLISRRHICNLGRRFNHRGVDKDGNVANFVETEQIVHTSEGEVYSHVQVAVLMLFK